jgi:hypothetical protein
VGWSGHACSVGSLQLRIAAGFVRVRLVNITVFFPSFAINSKARPTWGFHPRAYRFNWTRCCKWATTILARCVACEFVPYDFHFFFFDAYLWLDELQRTAKVQRLRILYHDRDGWCTGVWSESLIRVVSWSRFFFQDWAWLAGVNRELCLLAFRLIFHELRWMI